PAPHTVADSISLSVPSNAHMARRAILESGGFSLAVSDVEILESQRLLLQTTGIFAEPAAAATVAGLLQSTREFRKDEVVVLLITGHGLKDVDAALAAVEVPPPVEANLSAIPDSLLH
ncbi:MAG: pyridoxal-phosphate dependent enzyme, partial [Acidobacteria bacterium]|nr:pyridoxal-phosphate dependent enzyme [Acidobacteriota bacterium]